MMMLNTNESDCLRCKEGHTQPYECCWFSCKYFSKEKYDKDRTPPEELVPYIQYLNRALDFIFNNEPNKLNMKAKAEYNARELRVYIRFDWKYDTYIHYGGAELTEEKLKLPDELYKIVKGMSEYYYSKTLSWELAQRVDKFFGKGLFDE